MENQKSRAYLKSLFRAGSIPTDSDFGKLIDSMQNAVDDKVQRREDGKNGQSLCIGAGQNGVLMSFFASLDQAGSNWSLQLTPSNGLSIKAKNRATPVITFDGNGNVGIGTDAPQTTLDVRGNVQAASQSLTGDLKVAGRVSVGALEIAGLSTQLDAGMMQRIIAHLSAFHPTNAEIEAAKNAGKPLSPITITRPTQISNPQSPTTEAPIDTPPQHSGQAPISLPLDASALAAQGTWHECSVPAGRLWQDVAGPFVGIKVLVAIGWVMGLENRSVCHVTAANIDGDPSSGAITTTVSYQGRPRGKIIFRWNGNRHGYFLQCRTALRYPPDVSIHLRIQELL